MIHSAFRRFSRPATAAHIAGAMLLATLCTQAWGQIFTISRDQLIKFTEKSTFERFPDGRPKVPDALLDKVRGLSAEEVLGIARRGFTQQYVDGLKALNGKKLVGRAFTVKLMPARPDVESVIQADFKEKSKGRLSHQTALDMLQPGDVFVVDAFGSVESGGIVGDNLAYYVWKTTGAGFVIDGGIRDLEGIAGFDMAGYFRGATPPAIRNLMVAGINVPIRVGGATVLPGDVVLGDREGVYFIPPQLVQEVVDEADITHIHDEWTRMKFDTRKYRSSEIYGRPTDPALIQEYETYLKQKLGADRYESYKKRQQSGGGGQGGQRRQQ